MSKKPDLQQLKQTASQVRRDIVRMVHSCQSGHPGGSLGCTDFFVLLYFHLLRYSQPFKMDGKGEDIVTPYASDPIQYSTPFSEREMEYPDVCLLFS